jgi:hypothetical protein
LANPTKRKVFTNFLIYVSQRCLNMDVRIAKLRTAGTHYPMLNLVLTLIAFTCSIGWPWFGIVG